MQEKGGSNVDKEVERLITGHRDAMNVRRIFGDPFEKNGAVVLKLRR